MITESRKEQIDSIELLLREELHCYEQMYSLALARSKAVEESEYFSLEDVKPGLEKLQRKIQGLEKELEPMRRAWDAGGIGRQDEASVLKELVQEIRRVIGEILTLEEGSFIALSATHSGLKGEILGLTEKDRLAGYALQTDPLPRFLNVST